MGKKTVVKWVLDENDKNQIKQYSEKISKIFKLYGYDPKSNEQLGDYFDDLDCYFGFIPCISEGYSECEDEEYDAFCEDADEALDDAYDPNVKITLEDVETYAKEQSQTLEDVIYEKLSYTNSECEVSDWILANCDPITKQKFIDWVYNK